MVDATVKLLSCANQLCRMTKRVTLEFEDGEAGTMGYLNRLGFFDHLDATAVVLPSRPAVSGAAVYGGANAGLVEVRALRAANLDGALPGHLADCLADAAGVTGAKKDHLSQAAFTVFSELIQNVYRHSETTLDGYAALQYYRRGRKVTVAVSDSGLGIMQTLRPGLKAHFPLLAAKSDADLLVEMVSSGVSRYGRDNGCGIRQCARNALALKAAMEIRMPMSRAVFRPSTDTRFLGIATFDEQLPLIWGTHVSLDFRVD
ncbi:MAG: hypothetical protein KF776_06710 [Burkholderiales bacterium]|nr:hypothetical protein [Burkholderiales bacterium]